MILKKDREDCPQFTPCVPGRSPEWHQDQAMLAEIQKRDEDRKEADRQARLEDRADERAWQVEQKADEHKWQAKQKADEREWQLGQKWRDRIFAIVLALGGFFLGWLFSRDKPSDTKPEQEIKQEKKAGIPAAK